MSKCVRWTKYEQAKETTDRSEGKLKQKIDRNSRRSFRLRQNRYSLVTILAKVSGHLEWSIKFYGRGKLSSTRKKNTNVKPLTKVTAEVDETLGGAKYDSILDSNKLLKETSREKHNIATFMAFRRRTRSR